MIIEGIELEMLQNALAKSKPLLDLCKGSIVEYQRVIADRVVMLTKINDELNIPQNDG